MLLRVILIPFYVSFPHTSLSKLQHEPIFNINLPQCIEKPSSIVTVPRDQPLQEKCSYFPLICPWMCVLGGGVCKNTHTHKHSCEKEGERTCFYIIHMYWQEYKKH